MNLIELATAVTHSLPITIIVLNNGSLGMVRQMQTQFFDNRYSQTTLGRKTDFTALSAAFGAAGHCADTLDELDEIMKIIPDDRPCVIDCRIDIDEKVLPLIPIDGDIRGMLFD